MCEPFSTSSICDPASVAALLQVVHVVCSTGLTLGASRAVGKENVNFATDANGTGHVLSTKSCLRRLTSVTFLSFPFPVLSLPLQEVKTLCCKHPCFLDYCPALIAAKLDLWADVLCVDRSAIACTVMVSPWAPAFGPVVPVATSAHPACSVASTRLGLCLDSCSTASSACGIVTHSCMKLCCGHTQHKCPVCTIEVQSAALGPMLR